MPWTTISLIGSLGYRGCVSEKNGSRNLGSPNQKCALIKYSFREEFVNTSSWCAPDKPDIGESGKCLPLFAFRAPGRRGWGPSPGALAMLTWGPQEIGSPAAVGIRNRRQKKLYYPPPSPPPHPAASADGIEIYICSAQSKNRYNSGIVLRKVRILTLSAVVGILTLRKTISELLLRKVGIGTK